MAVNRGKQFEQRIKEAFEKVPNASIIRLIDPQAGYSGVQNICDFIAYKYPHMYVIECKSHHGKSFPFGAITDNQRKGLRKQANISGVISGVMLWFVDYDKTYFLPSKVIDAIESNGKKSINLADADKYCFEIIGKKKRVLFEYDLYEFIKKVNPSTIDKDVLNIVR